MINFLCFLAGPMIWSLTEYSLHRFLGHEFKFDNLFRKEHVAHHARKDYFAPMHLKLITATIIAVVTFLMLSLVLPPTPNMIFTLSFVGSFLSYEYYHYYLHCIPPKTEWGRQLRKHHFYHHFTNPNLNHGVTSTFWDRVFGTYKREDTVQIHRKFAMDWLLDNPEFYRSDYVVREVTPYT